MPEDEWFIVENTHEPVITKEAFEKALQLMKRDTRTAPKQKELYLFSGFLRCVNCGKAVSHNEIKGNVYYRCTTYVRQSRSACTIHTIKHNRLEIGVLYAIRQQVHMAVAYYAKPVVFQL